MKNKRNWLVTPEITFPYYTNLIFHDVQSRVNNKVQTYSKGYVIKIMANVIQWATSKASMQQSIMLAKEA
jgi:hypothetical protein